MSQNWYYTKDGKNKSGPVTAAQLKELARSGQLQPTDMVKREDMQKWMTATSVQGLFPSNAQTAPPLIPKPVQSAPPPLPPLPPRPPRPSEASDRPTRKEQAKHLLTVALATWRGWSWKVQASVGGGAAFLFLLMVLSCGGLGGPSARKGRFPAGNNVDFSGVDYSVPEVDYAKGPQGQRVEEREGVFPDTDAVEREQQGMAGKMYKESGFVNSGGEFQRHGVRTLWYPLFRGAKKGDKKFAEEQWYDGKLHGKLIAWDKDGKKRLERTYREGKEHGKETTWYGDGQKQSEQFFFQGAKHGPFQNWWENGKSGQEGAYEEGLQVGKWNFSYENGKQKAVNYFAKGKAHGPQEEYHQNGQKAKEWTAVEGMSEGKFIEWDEKGKKVYEGEYVKGREKGNFVEGKPEANTRQQFVNAVLGFRATSPIPTMTIKGRQYDQRGGGGARKMREYIATFGPVDPKYFFDGELPKYGGKIVKWQHRCSDGPLTMEAEVYDMSDETWVLIRRIGMY